MKRPTWFSLGVRLLGTWGGSSWGRGVGPALHGPRERLGKDWGAWSWSPLRDGLAVRAALSHLPRGAWGGGCCLANWTFKGQKWVGGLGRFKIISESLQF